MTAVPPDYQLNADERANPLLWFVMSTHTSHGVDVSDAVMRQHMGESNSRKLKSFGHDAAGVHFLLTRGGTIIHTDRAYTRYSHQLVLRNDGNRLRGMARYDGAPHMWHPPLQVGAMYCLDTHSPHQGTRDPRMGPLPGRPVYKAVIAVDRDEPLLPRDALALLERLLGGQLADWDTTTRPVRPSRKR